MARSSHILGRVEMICQCVGCLGVGDSLESRPESPEESSCLW